MPLQLLNNASLLNLMSAAVQNACAQLVDLTVGSALRAILQANAAVALWMQWLVTQLLLTTRAATSTGADLDSWVADYGLARLPSVAAHGSVQLSRNNATGVVLVPPGGVVRTGDATQSFTIGIDAGNPAWNVITNSYQFLAGQTAITVPIVAIMAGASGNIQPGAISLIASSMPGVDAAGNPLATIGGLDAESDPALRVRASTYFASLSRATVSAIIAAVQGVQQGLSVLVQENTPAAGQFVVVVDDGSGNPPASLLQSIYAAVDAVRPIGTVFSVRPPVVQAVDVAITLTVTSGSNQAALAAVAAAAVTTMIDALPVGATLPITRIAALVYNSSAAILNVSVLIDGLLQDAVPAGNSVIRAANVTVQ